MESSQIRHQLLDEICHAIVGAKNYIKLRDIYVYLHIYNYVDKEKTMDYSIYCEQATPNVLFKMLGELEYGFLAHSQDYIIQYQLKNKNRIRFEFDYHYDTFMKCNVSEDIAQIYLRLRDTGYFIFIGDESCKYNLQNEEFMISIDELIGWDKSDSYKNTLKELLQ